MLKKLINKLENIVNKVKSDINIEILFNFLNWFHDKIDIHFNKNTEKNLIPKKGDIYLVNLGINIGSELNKTRPCVIVSDSKFNGGNNLIIVPLKTYKKVFNKYFNIIIIPDILNKLEEISIISLVNIKEVSKKRFIRKIGKIENKQISEINKKLAHILNIKKEEL